MGFEEFCTIVEKWKKEGRKLILKNLNGDETDNVIEYEFITPTFKSGTIVSFKTELSHSHVICEKNENKFKILNENLYEVETPNENYQIIVTKD